MDMDLLLLDILEDDDDLDVLDFIENGIPRQIYERNNYFEVLDDVTFRRRFRLTRECALQLLIKIEHELEYPLDINNSVSPMNQLLTCLRLYSSGGYLQQVADFMGMHVSTVCRIVKRVSESIARLCPQYIVFPNGIDAIQATQQDFFNIAAFPRVLGAIECTHIKIQSPGGNDAEIYRNRNQYFSINTQAICNSKLRIMNVVARWPGSVLDSTIFTHSRINNDFINNVYPNCLLLGGNGYASNNFLLTPLQHPRTPAEQLYNESHVRTQNVIERCFGVLKRRFPILAYGCRLKIDTLLAIIVATSVLHNICLEANDNEAPPVPEEINQEDLEEQIIAGRIVNNLNDGQSQINHETRAKVIQQHFGNL